MNAKEIEEIEQIAEEKIRASRQPRFNDRSQTFWNMYHWVKRASQTEPAYASDSRKRDAWLREYVKQEPFLHGVLATVNTIDKNRGWTLLGSEPVVKKYVERFHNFHAAPDQGGWRPTMAFLSHAYHCADIGAIAELEWQAHDLRYGFSSELSSIYTVDPAQCRLTGDIEYPLAYTGDNLLSSQQQEWSNKAYFRLVDGIYTDVKFNGLGVCAVSRCLELAKILTALYDHDAEQLLSKAPRGLLLLQGITEEQWETTLAEREATMSELERRYYTGVQVFASNGLEKITAELVSLSKIPDGLDHASFTNLAMYLYALAFKYDPREFWPVSAGQLGTATETDVQHKKATGKGGLDFVLAYQEQLQDLLPNTVEFEFEARDVEGEMKDEALSAAIIKNVVDMATSDIINKQQAQILLAEAEVIHKEWAQSATQITTDKEDNPEGGLSWMHPTSESTSSVLDFLQKRKPKRKPDLRDYLDVDREAISRSLFYYPDYPIVKYTERNGLGSYQRIVVKKKERSYSFPDVSRGPGKGNWGHAGRPGEVGGSASGTTYPGDISGYPEDVQKTEWAQTAKHVHTPWDRGGFQIDQPDWAYKARNNYVVNDKKTLNNNKKLREGKEVDAEWIEGTDKLCETAHVDEERKVYRSALLKHATVSELKPGTIFTDKAFQSTSPDLEVAEDYMRIRREKNNTPSLKQVIFKLTLTPSTSFAFMDVAEYVLPRNTSILITAARDTSAYYEVEGIIQ